jgi:hypothetical protein
MLLDWASWVSLPKSLAPRWQGLSEQDLHTGGALVVARKG